mmetsp:Transcript_8103/g.17591  ORF Transcript_8103/g.17591 Transcript_8103/m.17591 type:complete len:266 (+) Transcript_8103:266-1063(+)
MNGCLVCRCLVVGDATVDDLRQLVDLLSLLLVEQGLPHTAVCLNHEPLGHHAIANSLLLHSLVSELLPDSHKLLRPVHEANSLDVVHVDNCASIQLRLEIRFSCFPSSFSSEVYDWLFLLLPLCENALPICVGLSLDLSPLRLRLVLGLSIQLGLDLLVDCYHVLVLLLCLIRKFFRILTLLQDSWKSLFAQGLRLVSNDRISVCLNSSLLGHLRVLSSSDFSGFLVDPPNGSFPLRNDPGHVHSRRIITSCYSSGQRQNPQHGL